MTKTPTTYLCKNAACSLGTVGAPGRFTGGATQDQILTLTGNPAGKHGPGVCPNCGTPGTEEKS